MVHCPYQYFSFVHIFLFGNVFSRFVAMKYPELVDRLIIMNCPHFKVFQQNLQRNCGQLCKSWYMFLFQVPKVPEFLFSMSDYSAIQNTFTGAQQSALLWSCCHLYC
jgi:hypothetical protein